jgi:hypothetical protein
MHSQIVKISFDKPIFDFSRREKFVNTQIQKNIDLFNHNGFIVLEHNILTKNDSYASVEFKLKRMVG